jgi:multicomponent Na+:H+ antiporter subunit E
MRAKLKQEKSAGARFRFTAPLWRTFWFALLWWALVDGDMSSWWLGAPTVLVAGILSAALWPTMPIAWWQSVRFAPFFLIRSLLGGIDVAYRALRPRMPIAPRMVEYRLRFPTGPWCVVLVNTISLLPGTLGANLSDGVLTVHALDARGDIHRSIHRLETRIARLFRIEHTELPAQRP